MRQVVGNVSTKGQITLPAEMRAMLGLHPGDKVRIALEDDTIVVKRVSATLADGYRSIPSLGRPLTDDEITEIAAAEAVRDFFKDSESA